MCYKDKRKKSTSNKMSHIEQYRRGFVQVYAGKVLTFALSLSITCELPSKMALFFILWRRQTFNMLFVYIILN